MEERPIENLMMTAMSSIENMIDVNKIIGDIVTTQDGTVIIPVSKVMFGFAAGGSEFAPETLKNRAEANLPFGGGSGAGVNISPMGFVVIKDGITKLLTLENTSPIDKLVDAVPELINKIEDFLNSNSKKEKLDKRKMDI